jgi:hypothetical protein
MTTDRRTFLRGLLTLCSGALATSGCGYTLAGHGSFLPAYIHTVGIPMFTNHTTVFNLESKLTEKVRAEFIGRGKYQILPQDTGVDAVLVGDVAAVGVAPTAFNSQQLASRYVITMTASIQFRDSHENKLIWENPSVTFRQEYEAAASTNVAIDPNAFLSQEANALDRVCTEFAQTIVSSILEAF